MCSLRSALAECFLDPVIAVVLPPVGVGHAPCGEQHRLEGPGCDDTSFQTPNDVLPPTGPRGLGGGGREGGRRSENRRSGGRCAARRYAERYAPEQRSQRVVDYAPRCRR